jgi:DNA-binding transcriptional LysR family regulator
MKVEVTMDRLKMLEVLRTISERGSLTKAAQVHQISVPSLSRAVQDIEQELGLLIFHRTTRKLTPTSAGTRVLEQVNVLLEQYELFSASCHANAHEIQGDVAIEVSNLFCADKLIPIISEFNREYPLVRIKVDWTDHACAKFRGTADLAIVTQRSPVLSCVERPLNQIPIGLYAAPSRFGQSGAPREPKEVERLARCDQQPGMHKQTWTLRNKICGSTVDIRLPLAIRSNCLDALIIATICGTGVAVLPASIAQRYESRGELTRILNDWQLDDLSAFLLYESRSNLPARVRKLMEYVLARVPSACEDRRCLPTLPSCHNHHAVCQTAATQ